jgi:hypothetical protein
VNVTAVETLERRLKATRDAMAGELERARNSTLQAAAARERANEHAATITALEEAIEELRGWAPAVEQPAAPDPLAASCPSCQARTGDPCRSPAGDTVEPHATRMVPA